MESAFGVAAGLHLHHTHCSTALSPRRRPRLPFRFAFIEARARGGKSSTPTASPNGDGSDEDGNANYVDMKNVKVTYSRSSGPGGQNVNKVESKVQLHVPVEHIELPEDAVDRLRSSHGSRISKTDDLIISADDQRTRHANYRAAVKRLREVLSGVAVTPKPWNKNSKTRKKFNEQRLQRKKQHADKKKERRTRVDF